MVMVELDNIHPPLDLITSTEEEYRDAIDKTKSKCLVAASLVGADVNRFGSMLETLKNDYLRGYNNCYPTDLNEAHKLMSNWSNIPKNISRILEGGHHNGISFLQDNA